MHIKALGKVERTANAKTLRAHQRKEKRKRVCLYHLCDSLLHALYMFGGELLVLNQGNHST